MNQINGLPSLDRKVPLSHCATKRLNLLMDESWANYANKQIKRVRGAPLSFFFFYILPFGRTRLPQPHPEQMCGSLCALKLCLLLDKREWFQHKSAHDIVFGLSVASEARGLSHDSCNETWMSGLIDALRTIKKKKRKAQTSGYALRGFISKNHVLKFRSSGAFRS